MTGYRERWAVNTCYESKNLILIIHLSKTPYKLSHIQISQQYRILISI